MSRHRVRRTHRHLRNGAHDAGAARARTGTRLGTGPPCSRARAPDEDAARGMPGPGPRGNDDPRGSGTGDAVAVDDSSAMRIADTSHRFGGRHTILHLARAARAPEV